MCYNIYSSHKLFKNRRKIMAEFMYENEAQVRKLSKKLCANGEVKRSYDKESREIYKFLLSYWVLSEERIHPRIYEKIRTELIRAECSKDNIIFFDKLNSIRIDTIYFETYMKEKEKDRNFRDNWYTYFSKIA